MPVSDRDLRGALAQILGRPVSEFSRRSFPYSSSHCIEELDVLDGKGGRLTMLFKNLGAPTQRWAKPPFVRDPLREIATYEVILAPGGVDAPACLGAHVDERQERAWLFLEKLEGRPLWQIGEPQAWTTAARWLADLHGRGLPTSEPRLLRYDARWFGRWLERALARTPPGALDTLRENYHRVADRLASWPTTFLHGEFYPSNVLLQPEGSGFRVRPLDWEMAGVGPGLLDLAALISGRWTEEERRSYARAYFDASPDRLRRRGEADFLDALAHCRLHVAIQWLGWSAAWEPPGEHGHDWLAEALRLGEELEL